MCYVLKRCIHASGACILPFTRKGYMHLMRGRFCRNRDLNSKCHFFKNENNNSVYFYYNFDHFISACVFLKKKKKKVLVFSNIVDPFCNQDLVMN